jgi:hypothetical protein
MKRILILLASGTLLVTTCTSGPDANKAATTEKQEAAATMERVMQ